MPDIFTRVDPGAYLPPDRQFWTTPQMWDPETREPTWTSGWMCKTFLPINPHSLLFHVRRARGVEGLPDLDPPRRSGGIEQFLWRLYDIEVLAHHLATRRARAITPARLWRAVTMVRLCAEVHDYL